MAKQRKTKMTAKEKMLKEQNDFIYMLSVLMTNHILEMKRNEEIAKQYLKRAVNKQNGVKFVMLNDVENIIEILTKGVKES